MTRAGRSALLMGLKLWGRHLSGAATVAGGVAVVVTVAAVVVVDLSGSALAFGAGVGGVLLVVLGRLPDGARRWIQGGLAEFRTARLLATARRSGRLRGWWFAHDLRIPRSRANLDHVAVHPSGRVAVYLDTKAWHAKGATVRVSGRRLMYGPWDQSKAVDTVKWEASKVADQLPGVRVVAVIVCDRTNVKPGVTGTAIGFDGVYVVSSRNLVDLMRSIGQGYDRNKGAARRVRRAVTAGFPAK